MGIRDCNNGFRAIKTDLFLNMTLKEGGFTIILEELYHAKKLGCRICEVPTVLSARTEQQAPSKFVIRFALVREYLKYSIMAFFAKVAGIKTRN